MEPNPKRPTPFKREITLVFGQTGTGKSQYTKRIIKQTKRVMVIDPQDEYEKIQHLDTEGEIKAYLEKNPKVFRVGVSDLRLFDACSDIISLCPESLFVIEESQRIIPPRAVLPESFEDLIYRGRHSGTSIHLVAQRPTTVDIAVRSQFHKLITFRQTESRDIDWILDVSGYELEEEIKHLEVMEYLEINREGYEKKRLEGFVR
jgi:DNA helicase HerA-like ATPase